VSFQVELTFEGLIDRLDDLPQRFEQVRPGPLGFPLAGWPQQLQVTLGKAEYRECDAQ
jgi:hypothetical protein